VRGTKEGKFQTKGGGHEYEMTKKDRQRILIVSYFALSRPVRVRLSIQGLETRKIERRGEAYMKKSGASRSGKEPPVV